MYTNLNFHSEENATPKHIAIIPDGGRRWARQHGVAYKEAYLASIKKIVDLLEELYRNEVQYVSLYFASAFNFFRSKYEIDSFYEASTEGILRDLVPFSQNKKVTIKIVGYRDEQYKMPEKELVSFKTNRKLFICFNYNSFDEIESAFCKKGDSEESFVNFLDIPYPVDILIRTGGAQTLSGFLLPQLAFSRLFFLEKLFNDLTLEDVQNILITYKRYNLKYGE